MDHPSPPPAPQPELPPSAAFVPQRRRRTTLYRRQATIPVVVPAPAAPLALPAAPHQIPDPPAAADEAPDTSNLRLLVDTALSQADAEAEARAASAHPAPSPPPSPAGKKLRSSPPMPRAAAADEEKEKPHAPPQLPPLAVDEPQSSLSMGHGDAVTKGSAAKDCKKAAACPQGDGAGSSKGDQGGGGVASPAAAASPQPLGDDEYELEPGEIPPEKPAAGCNAGSAHESLLGNKNEEMAEAGEEEAKTMAAVGEPAAATGSSAHGAPAAVVGGAGVVVGRDDGKGKAPAELSAAEQKRMREVFVGGLCREATEVDVWSALSAAGEITQVRMIRDRTHCSRNNVGYCFVAYRDAAMASKAVAEFANVKICGKPCRVEVPEGNEKVNKLAQRDHIIEDYYNRLYEQRQTSPTLAVHSSYMTSWEPRHARYENNTYAIPASSYIVSTSPAVAMPAGCFIPMYHNGNGVYLPSPDLNHGRAGQSGRSQMGQSGSSRPTEQPHRSRN